MRFHLAIAFQFVFCALMAFPIDTSQIRNLFQQAYVLSEDKDYVAAAPIARQALKDLSTLGERPTDLEVGLIHILGDCALDQGDMTEAARYYRQANALLESRGLTDHPLLIENFNKTGNYYLEIKDFGKALDNLNRGLDLARKVLDHQDLQVANLYNNIGICLYYIGDLEKAIDHHRQVLTIRSAQLPPLHPQIAQSFNNLGLCLLNQGAYQEAIEAFLKAIDIYAGYYGTEHQNVADVYLNLGNVYARLQNPDRFMDYNRQALKVYRHTLGNTHPSVALCYNNLANAFSARNDYRQASGLYQQALEIMTANYGEVHPDVAMSWYNLGVINYQAGEARQAMEALNHSFRSLNYSPGPNSGFDEVNNHHTLLQLFKFMVIIEIQGYYDSEDNHHLTEALDYYRQIDRLLDYLYTRYEASGSKLRLLDSAHDLYDPAIELALALFRISGEDRYLHEAFRYSEKSKGILLLEGLKKAEAEAFAGIPSDIIAAVNELEASISELEKQRFLNWARANSPDDAMADSLSTLIFEQKQVLSERLRALESDYPRYYELRYETATVPAEAIRDELLTSGQTLLEYFLGAENLHIFVINDQGLRVESREVDRRFFQAMETFNETIRNFPSVPSGAVFDNLKAYAGAAHLLYEYLIQPIEAFIGEQLIIIPDGELGLLSFGALLSGLPEDPNDLKSYPYLAMDHSFSYNYSARLLKEMAQRKSGRRLRPYFGLAPGFRTGNSQGLAPLRYNSEEIKSIYDRIGGKMLLQEEATKANFLTYQSAFKVIHLATHGKANSSAGDFSFLAFSETAGAQGNDALLFVKEIYNLSTNAELVLLSACETSAGELHKGEGIASIARSFSYAGARSLIATLWSVDDKATRDLVELFFGNTEKGLTKDQALQAAIRSFLAMKGQREAHPYYWASFIPVGNMESIRLNPANPILVWSLPLALILSLVYFWKNKKSS